jgi:hypothetical protein
VLFEFGFNLTLFIGEIMSDEYEEDKSKVKNEMTGRIEDRATGSDYADGGAMYSKVYKKKD